MQERLGNEHDVIRNPLMLLLRQQFPEVSSTTIALVFTVFHSISFGNPELDG
jgi:hypothetical protein